MPKTTVTRRLLLALVAAAGAPGPGAMDSLVSFGDSYSEEGRLAYLSRHHTAPPAGVVLPASNATWSGGYAWTRLAARRAGAALYNYAVAGGHVLGRAGGPQAPGDGAGVAVGVGPRGARLRGRRGGAFPDGRQK